MTRDDPSDFGVIRYWYTTFSPFPMKPDIYEYPEHANARELLQYKIDVEQAALDGKPIEITEIELDAWHPYSDVIPGLLPLFRWNEYSYRVARPKIAAGHNPDRLTEDQVETSAGWRLLTVDELEDSKQPGLQFWGLGGTWKTVFAKNTSHKRGVTYRTKAAPGAYLPKPVQPSTVLGWLNLLPDGYRERALKNRDADRDGNPTRSTADALDRAFTWCESPEGDVFWADVYAALITNEDLPPLPAVKKLAPWSLDNFVWPDCVRRRGGGNVFGVQLATEDGLYIGIHDSACIGKDHQPIDWKELADHFEYSIDNGKTWTRCAHMEDAK